MIQMMRKKKVGWICDNCETHNILRNDLCEVCRRSRIYNDADYGDLSSTSSKETRSKKNLVILLIVIVTILILVGLYAFIFFF